MVLVTVTLSEVVSALRLPLLLFSSATNSRMKTAAPATHTHGDVYHSVSVTLTVVLELVVDSVVSWATHISCSAKTMKETNINRKANGHAVVFIFIIFWLRIPKYLFNNCASPFFQEQVGIAVRLLSDYQPVWTMKEWPQPLDSDLPSWICPVSTIMLSTGLNSSLSSRHRLKNR